VQLPDAALARGQASHRGNAVAKARCSHDDDKVAIFASLFLPGAIGNNVQKRDFPSQEQADD
jgi:hypothetical protein